MLWRGSVPKRSLGTSWKYYMWAKYYMFCFSITVFRGKMG